MRLSKIFQLVFLIWIGWIIYSFIHLSSNNNAANGKSGNRGFGESGKADGQYGNDPHNVGSNMRNMENQRQNQNQREESDRDYQQRQFEGKKNGVERHQNVENLESFRSKNAGNTFDPKSLQETKKQAHLYDKIDDLLSSQDPVIQAQDEKEKIDSVAEIIRKRQEENEREGQPNDKPNNNNNEEELKRNEKLDKLAAKLEDSLNREKEQTLADMHNAAQDQFQEFSKGKIEKQEPKMVDSEVLIPPHLRELPSGPFKIENYNQPNQTDATKIEEEDRLKRVQDYIQQLANSKENKAQTRIKPKRKKEISFEYTLKEKAEKIRAENDRILNAKLGQSGKNTGECGEWLTAYLHGRQGNLQTFSMQDIMANPIAIASLDTSLEQIIRIPFLDSKLLWNNLKPLFQETTEILPFHQNREMATLSECLDWQLKEEKAQELRELHPNFVELDELAIGLIATEWAKTVSLNDKNNMIEQNNPNDEEELYIEVSQGAFVILLNLFNFLSPILNEDKFGGDGSTFTPVIMRVYDRPELLQTVFQRFNR